MCRYGSGKLPDRPFPNHAIQSTPPETTYHGEASFYPDHFSYSNRTFQLQIPTIHRRYSYPAHFRVFTLHPELMQTQQFLHD
ncbi:hypothetical protein EGT74_14375 [Chitinophaga lutea]|uniref:Uncharacterized protein n=1 Tax=Chitinophaga lutea TaxID=2488634 RepID=A0A3N4PJ57_9BACT|nr:hypothetical protein EGT74_14375 [Chitinophaga lutea]